MNDQSSWSLSFCVTHRCNLNCSYCYQVHDEKRMSLETAKAVMGRIFSSVLQEFDAVQIGFIGGEPLLEFDLIREICEYTWAREQEKPYIFYATTNGTVLTDAMKGWLVENVGRFKLGLSLDGTCDTQNHNRSNSFDKIDIPFFQKHYLDQGVKMTISEYSIAHLAENVKYLHSLGFEVQGANLAEGNFDWGNENFVSQIAGQLKELVSFYVERPDLKVCQMFDMNLAMCEQKVKSKQKYCGIGHGTNFFDVDGKEYPCPYCTPMIFSAEQLEEIKKVDFTSDENFLDADCYDNCYLFPICSSCAGNNYRQTGSFARHERSKCRITKLTSLFIADLQARKIVNGQDGLDDDTKYWTIEAIKKIKPLYFDEFRQYIEG